MHGRYGRFLQIQSNLGRKKLHRTNQGSNFLESSFSNRDNVKAKIQFRRGSQPQHLKRWFFFKKKPIHYHINSICAIRLAKRKQLNFAMNEPLSYEQSFISALMAKSSNQHNCQNGLCSQGMEMQYFLLNQLEQIF